MTKGKILWCFIRFSQLILQGNVEISLENLWVDNVAWRGRLLEGYGQDVFWDNPVNDNKNQDIIRCSNVSLKTHLLITTKPLLWTVLLVLKIPNFTQSPMFGLGFPAKGATCKSKYCFKTIFVRRNHIFCFFFFWNTIWSVPKWPRTGFRRGHVCSNSRNPAMVRSRSDTESLTLFGSIIRQGFVVMVLQTISAFFTSLLWTHRQI